MKCPHCGYDKIQPNFNFCPGCSRPLLEYKTINALGQQPKPLGHYEQRVGIESEIKIKSQKPDFESIRDCVVLGLDSRELARRINVSEFERLSSAKGVYVLEGVVAVLMIDNHVASMLSNGIYFFPDVERFDGPLRHILRFLRGRNKTAPPTMMNCVVEDLVRSCKILERVP